MSILNKMKLGRLGKGKLAKPNSDARLMKLNEIKLAEASKTVNLVAPIQITKNTQSIQISPYSKNLSYQNFVHNTKDNRKNKISSLQYDPLIIDLIHNDLNNMTREEKILSLKKIITDDLLDNILLTYSFNNLGFNTRDHMDMNEFIKITKVLLAKYNSKAGGEYFDDDEWTIYTHTNTKPNDYILEVGECIFENTISYPHYTKEQTIMFLRNLVKILNKLAENILVCEKKIYVKSEHSIIVHVYAMDKQIVNHNNFKNKTIDKY